MVLRMFSHGVTIHLCLLTYSPYDAKIWSQGSRQVVEEFLTVGNDDPAEGQPKDILDKERVVSWQD